MTTLSASPHSHAISFAEFRDFLLLLPRKASPAEIYQYYKVRKYMGDDGRGTARVTMEGMHELLHNLATRFQNYHRQVTFP
jgi:solute carrier family 25 phosphate transporter 23/24/25/41